MSKTLTVSQLILAASVMMSLSACAILEKTGERAVQSDVKSSAVAAQTFPCWDGSRQADIANCPSYSAPTKEVQCWNGSLVSDISECPVRKTTACWNGALVANASECPARAQ